MLDDNVSYTLSSYTCYIRNFSLVRFSDPLPALKGKGGAGGLGYIPLSWEFGQEPVFSLKKLKRKGKINKRDEMSIYIENIENIFYLRDL